MRPPSEAVLAELIRRAADPEPALLADVESAYAELAEAVARRRPVCDRSGRCCRFEQFGHRLFVTSPEIVHFLHHLPAEKLTGLGSIGADELPACPFQADRLCTVHAIRPLGCRLFFCQAGAEAWGRPLHEELLARLKAACTARSLPYLYVEWTRLLGALGSAAGAARAGGRGRRHIRS